MRIVHQWRNLKQLKCGGRGHTSDGINATTPGELAVWCPACPHPSINLPPNWELAPEDKQYVFMVQFPSFMRQINTCCRWIYGLFLGIDANFQLKCKKVSSEERNPSLNKGWAFFVEEGEYKEHLAKNWVQKQEVWFL